MVHFNSNSPPCSPHRLHSVSVSFTCGKNFNLIFTKKIRNFYSISLKNTKCVQILIRERRMICEMLYSKCCCTPESLVKSVCTFYIDNVNKALSLHTALIHEKQQQQQNLEHKWPFPSCVLGKN